MYGRTDKGDAICPPPPPPPHYKWRGHKNKCHFQAHFPSGIVRKGKDLLCVHCATLSSNSITQQTLPGMRKDLRILQMPTVARQH